MSRQIREWSRAEQAGVAMISALLAIFILTIVVAALVLATMGESGLSRAQSRSAQAIHLAEAGAYRAVVDLRHRIAVDLNNSIGNAPRDAINDDCRLNQGWRIIATYAKPATESPNPWTFDDGARLAKLSIGVPGQPIEVRDAAGDTVGSFYATIYVRPTSTTNPNTCISGGVSSPASYTFWFDYFVVATGVTPNAQRTVCLKTPGNSSNCGDWLGAPDKGAARWDSPGATHGWPVLITEAPYSQWALMLLKREAALSPETWLFTTSLFNGPVHTNTRFSIWGNPTFNDKITQVLRGVWFGNGGAPPAEPLDKISNPPDDRPIYNGGDLSWGNQAIDPPTRNSPFWAVIGEDPSKPGTPTGPDVCGRTTDKDCPKPGIYFMDQCGTGVCGGIFVRGNVERLELSVQGEKQVISIVTTQGASKTFVLQSPTATMVCTATCDTVSKGFNGMIFVKGNITSRLDDPGSGLHGTVDQDTRLTIAADGEIRITDHLKYEAPPAGRDDTVPNVLGLYAWCSTPGNCPNRNVTVVGQVTPPNLKIHGSVLAPWGKFWVEGWDWIPEKGTLQFLGGTVQETFGEWGGFVTEDVVTGYSRSMVYDQRFLNNISPPFFPITNVLTEQRWPQPLTVDKLYDRPLWEEVLRQP